jgi:sugar (pentulose or hexulose) kinase
VICSEERSLAEEKGIDPYDIMSEMAEKSPIGSRGLIVVPHFMGAGSPHWNPKAKGIIYGLTLAHNRGDIIRSVMESVAYEIRKNLKLFKELGNEIEEMRITGGGSRSNIWNQIMADVLNVTLARGELEESTSVGAMMLAAYGVGDYKDLIDASEKLANMSMKWKPNPDNLLIYNQLFKAAESIYEAIETGKIADISFKN